MSFDTYTVVVFALIGVAALVYVLWYTINLINFTNYTDMLKDVGSASNTIMIPHVTGAVDSLEGAFRNAIISSAHTSRPSPNISYNRA